MKYHGCMFDLDGTLLNTIEALTCATNTTLNMLGLPGITPEQITGIVGDGYKMQMERALLLCKDEALSRLGEALPLYMENFAKYCMKGVVPYDGICRMLEDLKAHKVRLAVFSNKPHDQAVECVEAVFGKGYFDCIRGEMAGTPKKPAPDGALLILKELSLEPADCLYAGDTNTDMQTGIAAGMDTAGVTWGFRGREELLSFSPGYLVNSPAQITEIVAGNGGNSAWK